MNRGKPWRNGEFYLVLFLFAFMLMIVLGAVGFPYKARIFPLLVGSAGLLLIITDILHILVPGFGRRFISLRGGELFELGKVEKKEEVASESEVKTHPRRIMITFLWFVGGFIAFYVLGYLLFSVLFLFFFLVLYTSLSLIRSLEITSSFCLALWLAFSLFLKLEIFAGSALF